MLLFLFSHKTLWSQSNILDYIPCFWDKVRESPWIICLGCPNYFPFTGGGEGIEERKLFICSIYLLRKFIWLPNSFTVTPGISPELKDYYLFYSTIKCIFFWSIHLALCVIRFLITIVLISKLSKLCFLQAILHPATISSFCLKANCSIQRQNVNHVNWLNISCVRKIHNKW